MNVTRREVVASLGTLAASAGYSRLEAGTAGVSTTEPPPHAVAPEFPRKADFTIVDGYTYLNGAFSHPMPRAAADAYHQAVERRTTLAPPGVPFVFLNPPPDTAPMPVDPKAVFASLINAKQNEISYIPNTSTGENLVVEALGIRRFDGNVVTDALHFDGALVHLLELKKLGLDLRLVKPRDGRIDMRELERVVDRKTKLIEISWVSMYNGFQHDLKAVCDLAHAHGAYVYADIIQGAGAVPLDVRASGVDFAATATYKWLMGDFGLGFLFVREELLGTVVRRTHWSYESAANTEIHLSPFDPQFPAPVTWTPGSDAMRYFQLGTMANGVAAALRVSLPYIQRLRVEAIQAWRQPMLEKLQAEMPRLGFIPQTPLDSTSPIVTFAHKDAETINKKLQSARIGVRVAPYYMRIAPSIYNDLHDVDRLLEALS
ncbi:MAG TPA: aminotransferase class V-fold PLP-dependent enzyme [Steroidobacteraceae bacterium]|jgi:selenocysteine lyase/cysteine desulfurase